MVLDILLYIGAVACLVILPPTVRDLWDLTGNRHLVGRLLHSVNLQKSSQWLGSILEQPEFPFQYVYDKQCHRLLTRDRLQEIMVHVGPTLHDRIAGPICLQNSRVTLDYSDIIMLGVSPLGAPARLPEMTSKAYRRIVTEAIVFGAMPQTTCEWLLDQSSHRLNTKIPRFWYLIHPECFKESFKKGQSRNDLGKLGLLLQILFRSNPMIECIDQKDFKNYLRWIVRICLVGLELNRPSKSEDLGDVFWMREELDGVLANIDAIRMSKDAYRLDEDHLKVLMLARSLLRSVSRWIFFQENSLGSRDAGHMPDFDDVWYAIGSNEVAFMDEGLSMHWKISVFSLYMQLHPGIIPWIAKRLAEFSHMWTRVWSLDWISLIRLQIDPISFSSVWKCQFMVKTLVSVAEKSEAVQNYVLKWTLHHRDTLSHGTLQIQALAIIKAIPLDKRVQYIRRLWIGGEGQGEMLTRIQILHRLAEPKFKAEMLSPTQYIRDYFKFLFWNNRVVRDEKTGVARLVIGLPGRVKLLASMCALALLYDVPLPATFDVAQISTLLNLDGEGVEIVSDQQALHSMFHIEREIRVRSRRASLEHDSNLARIAAGQRTFHETVPLSGIFEEKELSYLLGFR